MSRDHTQLHFTDTDVAVDTCLKRAADWSAALAVEAQWAQASQQVATQNNSH